MKRLAVASLLALGAAGCHSTNFDPTRLEFMDQQTRTVSQDELPPGMAESFRKQFPQGTTITQIEERQYNSGVKFYRVHYALENRPGEERVMDFSLPDSPATARPEDRR